MIAVGDPWAFDFVDLGGKGILRQIAGSLGAYALSENRILKVEVGSQTIQPHRLWAEWEYLEYVMYDPNDTGAVLHR
jgi:hypothetical protein